MYLWHYLHIILLIPLKRLKIPVWINWARDAHLSAPCESFLLLIEPEAQTFIRKRLYLDWLLDIDIIKICTYNLLIGLQTSGVKCINVIKKIYVVTDFFFKQTPIKVLWFTFFFIIITVNHVFKYCNQRTCTVVITFPTWYYLTAICLWTWRFIVSSI